MIKIILMATVSALIMATNSQADNVITAEIPTAVALSNHDINRIVCPGPMNDLIFSQEKGLTGHFSGNNAFIKFRIEDDGYGYVFAENPTELFIVCNGAVYTLIVTPTDIPSVTLRLASPKGDSFKKNIVHYQNLPLEKQALQIIKEAFDEIYPSSYRITEPDQKITLTPDLVTTLLQTVDVDGVGLRLKKYQVTSLVTNLTVDEKIFLSSSISDSILAIAVEDHNLDSGETTRVFVVEKKEQVQ